MDLKIKWFRKITVIDQLHINAINNLLLFPPQRTKVNLAGVTKINGLWTPIDGNHSICFTNNSAIEIIKDKDKYLIETSGDEAISALFKILNAKRIKIINDSFISAIDNFIMTEKSLLENGRYIADVVSTPMDGFYVLKTGDKKSYLVAKKSCNTPENFDKNAQAPEKGYIIDVVGEYYEKKLSKILNGDANRIRVVNCCVVNSSINVRILNKPPLDSLFKCQQPIIDYVVTTYISKKTKNLSILISGKPGLGKSTIAFLIAQRIKNQLGVDPYLIKGFNINSQHMQYHPVIGYYNPKNNTPIILLLDEFDIAMKKAKGSVKKEENVVGDRQFSSQDEYMQFMQMQAHAQMQAGQSEAISANTTNLNNFLDSVNDEPFLITVATTNRSIQFINENYGVYCRKGRFDMHFEMIDKTNTIKISPQIN